MKITVICTSYIACPNTACILTLVRDKDGAYRVIDSKVFGGLDVLPIFQSHMNMIGPAPDVVVIECESDTHYLQNHIPDAVLMKRDVSKMRTHLAFAHIKRFDCIETDNIAEEFGLGHPSILSMHPCFHAIALGIWFSEERGQK